MKGGEAKNAFYLHLIKLMNLLLNEGSVWSFISNVHATLIIPSFETKVKRQFTY